MKAKKGDLVILIALFLMIVAPVLTISFEKGRVSIVENRNLSNPPVLFRDDGKINDTFYNDFKAWFSDNLGFRSFFVSMAADIKALILHQSPNNQVEFGREGWLFYTPDHNIELATGEHYLTNEELELIANNQQRISEWYLEHGIDYILVLIPAKPSIYPEYIASKDVKIMTTICDQVERYLKEKTTVNVVNVKRYLIDRKADGQLYLKTDTHMTQFGSYVAYQAISNRLKDLGYNFTNFDISFSEEKAEKILACMVQHQFGETL